MTTQECHQFPFGGHVGVHRVMLLCVGPQRGAGVDSIYRTLESVSYCEVQHGVQPHIMLMDVPKSVSWNTNTFPINFRGILVAGVECAHFCIECPNHRVRGVL